jgi:hypothetical protein
MAKPVRIRAYGPSGRPSCPAGATARRLRKAGEPVEGRRHAGRSTGDQGSRGSGQRTDSSKGGVFWLNGYELARVSSTEWCRS